MLIYAFLFHVLELDLCIYQVCINYCINL